jgi:phasin family protein
MQDSRKTEDAKSMARESAEQVRSVGQEYQRTAEAGFEAATRSFGEATRGFKAVAAEVTNYSRRSMEDVIEAWEQLLSARSFPEIIEVQTRYAQKLYGGYVSQASKLTELYFDLTRGASRPLEEAARR